MVILLQQTCPLTDLQSLLRGKWNLAVICQLGPGAMQYCTLRRRLPDISEKVLNFTLDRLERHGFTERHVESHRPVHVSYTLTPRGVRFIRVLQLAVAQDPTLFYSKESHGQTVKCASCLITDDFIVPPPAALNERENALEPTSAQAPNT